MAKRDAGQPVAITLICHDRPPAEHAGQATEFGIQDKQQRLHSGSVGPDGTLLLTCEVVARLDAAGGLDWAGPFVHGPRGGRFVYLGYRVRDDSGWIRRWKIPLQQIGVGLLAEHSSRPEASLATEIASLGARVVLENEGGWHIR